MHWDKGHSWPWGGWGGPALGLTLKLGFYNLGYAWVSLKMWVTQAQQAAGALGSVRSREGWEPSPCLPPAFWKSLLLLAGSSSSVQNGGLGSGFMSRVRGSWQPCGRLLPSTGDTFLLPLCTCLCWGVVGGSRGCQSSFW